MLDRRGIIRLVIQQKEFHTADSTYMKHSIEQKRHQNVLFYTRVIITGITRLATQQKRHQRALEGFMFVHLRCNKRLLYNKGFITSLLVLIRGIRK